MLYVSPLIAIMVKQSDKFIALGVNAQFVGEAQSVATVCQRVIDGQFQLALKTSCAIHSIVVCCVHHSTRPN